MLQLTLLVLCLVVSIGRGHALVQNAEAVPNDQEQAASGLKVDVKAHRDRLFAGQPASFDVSVQNSGNGDLRDVCVAVLMPKAYCKAWNSEQLKLSEGSASDGGDVAYCWIELLPPGERRVVSTTIDPLESAAEVRLWVAAVSSDIEHDGLVATAQVSYEGVPALVVEIVNEPDPPLVGEEMMWTLRVRNQGIRADTNIKSAFRLPGVRVVEVCAPVKWRMEGDEVVFDAVDRLEPRKEITYSARVVVEKLGGRCGARVQSDYFRAPIEEYGMGLGAPR